MSEKAKKNIGYTLRAVGFLCAFVLIFNAVFSVMWLSDNIYSRKTFEQFYSLEENTVDAVYIGASTVREYFIAPQAFYEKGIAVFPLAIGNQPFRAAKYLIREVQKTQKPSLYIVDIRNLLLDEDPTSIRRTADSMRFSANRIEMIDYMLDGLPKKYADVDRLDYYFSFTLYHSRWYELNRKDFDDSVGYYRGFSVFHDAYTFKRPDPETLRCESKMKLSAENQQALSDFLNECRTLDAQVLFTITPFVITRSDQARLNTAVEQIRQSGCTVLDFNGLYDEMGIDFNADFRNRNHVNVSGARKFTSYLSAYLCDNCELPRRTNDPKYVGWREDYERLCAECPAYFYM